MSKLNKVLIIFIVILALALALLLYWQLVGFSDQYYAVYLTTGDLYFGKLSRFPSLTLSNVWFIQRNSQDSQNPYSLSQFKKAFWGPGDVMDLSEKEIVWTVKLRDDSPILDMMKNPGGATQGAQNSNQPQLPPYLPQLNAGQLPGAVSSSAPR